MAHQLSDDKIKEVDGLLQAGNGAAADWVGKEVGNPWLANIIKSYKNTFNRLPTANETMAAMPAFQNYGGSGESYISQLYQQQNPNEGAKKAAPEQYGAVDDLFTKNLGRAATDEEKDHFGTLLASKQYSLYDVGNMLQNLPENVRKQDEEFRTGLESKAQANDARYYNEQILPGIQSTFAKQGRSFDSSAFANSLAREATAQNRTRESFLSGLTADQYQGNKNRAYEDYVNNMSYTRGRSDLVADRNVARLYELENYNIQKQQYDEYLKRYGKRSGGMGAGAGSMIGMGIGAALAAPTGGMSIPMGAMLGSTLGGAGGSMTGL